MPPHVTEMIGYTSVFVVPFLLLVYIAVVVWQERKRRRHAVRLEEERQARSEALGPPPANHNWETDDAGMENGAREHKSKVPVAVSTAEVGKRFHAGPKNDQDY